MKILFVFLAVVLLTLAAAIEVTYNPPFETFQQRKIANESEFSFVVSKDDPDDNEGLSLNISLLDKESRIKLFRNHQILLRYIYHNLELTDTDVKSSRFRSMFETFDFFNTHLIDLDNPENLAPPNFAPGFIGNEIFPLFTQSQLLELQKYGYNLSQVDEAKVFERIRHESDSEKKSWLEFMGMATDRTEGDHIAINRANSPKPSPLSNTIKTLEKAFPKENNPVPICFANWENINKNNMAIHGADTILFCNHFYHSLRNALKEDLEKPIPTRTANFPIGPCHINTVFSFNSNSIKSTAKLKYHPKTSPDESYIVFTQPNSSPKNASTLPYRAHAVPFQKVFDFADTVCPEFIAMVPHDKSTLSKNFTQKVNTLTTRYNTNTTHIYNITFDEFYCHLTPKPESCTHSTHLKQFRLDDLPIIPTKVSD